MILQNQVSRTSPSKLTTKVSIGNLSKMEQKADVTNSYICNCHFLYQFLRWGYFVGIIPFKPVIVLKTHEVSTNKIFEVEFQRNKFQRVICWAIYLIGIFWSTLKLTNSYPDGGSLYAKPSRILAVVSVLFQMTYVLSFAYTFGIQGNRLKSLLNCCPPYPLKHQVKGFKVLYRLRPMLPIFLATFSTSLQFQEYLARIPKACLSDNDLQHDSLSSSTKIVTFAPLTALMDCKSLEKFRNILGFFTLALHFSAELIYNSFQTFLLVLAVSSRNFCLQINNEVKDLVELVSIVEKVKDFFQRLNKVGSVPFLLFWCQMIPWTGYRFLDSLPDPKGILQRTSTSTTAGKVDGKDEYPDSEEFYDVDSDLFVKLYNWCILINGCVIIYFCAETKSLVI